MYLPEGHFFKNSLSGASGLVRMSDIKQKSVKEEPNYAAPVYSGGMLFITAIRSHLWNV